MIAEQRSGQPIDCDMLKEFLQSLIELGPDQPRWEGSVYDIYKLVFEDPYINDAVAYFHSKARTLRQMHGEEIHITNAARGILNEELARIERYALPRTTHLVTRKGEAVLLGDPQAAPPIRVNGYC